MLNHGNETPANPSRVVVMGADGFVGGTIAETLKKNGMQVLSLDKKEIDLLSDKAAESLASQLKPEDSFVAVSAIAPCRNNAMLKDNIVMVKAMCDALQIQPVSHVVNISSDAVYAEDAALVDEKLNPSPSSSHGIMHLCREIMFKSVIKAPLAILRPSIMYGWRDPHNGYGPNRFMRLAAGNEEISFFGEGEEKRDHLSVEDLAQIVRLCLVHKSAGILNVATGQSYSFREVADLILKISGSGSKLKGNPRQNPVTHRHFDITDCHKAFPSFHYTKLEDGLKASYGRMSEVR